MQIGRFSAGIIKGGRDIGCQQYTCGCRVLSIWAFYFMWSGTDCKCGKCSQYFCKCICPLCEKRNVECECESYD